MVGDTTAFEEGTGRAEVTGIGGAVLPAQQAVRKAAQITRNRLRFIFLLCFSSPNSQIPILTFKHQFARVLLLQKQRQHLNALAQTRCDDARQVISLPVQPVSFHLAVTGAQNRGRNASRQERRTVAHEKM